MQNTKFTDKEASECVCVCETKYWYYYKENVKRETSNNNSRPIQSTISFRYEKIKGEF